MTALQYTISLGGHPLVSVNESKIAYLSYQETIKLVGKKGVKLMNNLQNLKFEKDEFVKIIKHSVHPEGYELITAIVKIPKFLMAQLNTHRNLAKNTASSRAIPCSKYRKMVNDDSVEMGWGMAKKGMSSDENISAEVKQQADEIYQNCKTYMMDAHEKLEKLGVHKEFTNRLLEPFAYTYAIVTGTEWEHFIKLRKHQDAQKQIREIAEQLDWYKTKGYEKKHLRYGEWHIPFDIDDSNMSVEDRIIMSTARCAWVSYNNHQKDAELKDAENMMDKLIESQHLSPLEHCQLCLETAKELNLPESVNANFSWYNNTVVYTRQYKGFYSLRAMKEDNDRT